MVICQIPFTDVIFAAGSIRVIFVITSDLFIVLAGNVMAILDLGAMYFLLAAVANKFHLLSDDLSVILAFIGVKMCLIDIYKNPVSLRL